jgi:upstream activation factor subunit UAF30
MARTSKTPATTAPVTATITPDVVPVIKTASKVPKAPKAPKAPKVEASVAPAVAIAVATDAENVVVSEEIEAPVAEQSLEFQAKLQQLGVLITTLKSEFKSLERKWIRELKVANKSSLKKKRKLGNRAPSGFVKPTRISDELAIFLEKPAGTEMARTEVTRDINKYIRTNNLQDKKNGRKINPDNKLAALLKLQKTDELTYFNLQRYMSPHFAKAAAKAEAQTATF